jgi:hypothetical protein
VAAGESVEIGTPEPGEALRDAYDVIQQVKLDLATTIVPVHVVSGLGSSAAAGGSGGYPWVAGRGTVVPAAGTNAFVGILNPVTSGRLVHIKRTFMKFTGANGYYATFRTSAYADVAARGGNALVEQCSAQAVLSVIYWGDVLTASLDVTGALNYYNAAPGVEDYPDAWLAPGEFFGYGVQTAAQAIADGWFEGEEFPL